MKVEVDLPPSQGAGTILRNRAFDGFRGFAMLVLMAAHFGGEKILPGAWLGINFFLVFSGFIIIYLMMVEKHMTGRVDIIRFYRRRAKRLLPGLFVLLTVLAVWALVWAEDYVRRGLRGDIIATLSYVMNWRLIITSDDYFVQFGTPSLLRHAWTLAVEEQFYVVAPFIVLAVFRWVHTRWMRVAVMLAMASVSAWIAAGVGVGSAHAQAHVYYGTDTRAQAIFIGIAFAFLLGPDNRGNIPKYPNGPLIMTLGWIAVIFNVWSYTWVSPWDPWVFEKGGILFFSLSTLPAFIVCLDHRENLMKRIMGNTFFVVLGLMTYGLYLWHWPIQIWLKLYVPGLDGWALFFAGTILTTVIAFISFRFLEVPIILGGLAKFAGGRRKARMLIVASLAVILALTFTVGKVPSLASQMAAGKAPMLVKGTPSYEPRDDQITMAVYGDSTALYLSKEFDRENYPDMSMVELAKPGCDLMRLPFDVGSDRESEPLEDCLESRKTLANDLEANNVDVLVLNVGTLAPLPHVTPEGPMSILDPGYEKYVRAELDDIREQARDAGVRQVQISTLPCRDTDLDFAKENPDVAELATSPDAFNDVIRQWAGDNDVPVLELNKVLGCEQGYVRKINGVRLYSDQLHFSQYAAQMIWTWMAPTVRDNFEAATQ